MPRTLLVTLMLLLASFAWAQQDVRVSGAHTDELVELPVEMRLGLFLDLGNAAREITSVRMVGGTFTLSTQGVVPDDRDLRPLTSGSFPLAFMIGNEFVVAREGVQFATAWLQPYHDVNQNGTYDQLFDEWFFRAPPELTDPFGYFNIVYVTDDVEVRTTPMTFQLRRGWNLVVARLVGGGLQYSLETSVDDVVMYSYGSNMTFENLDGQGEDAVPEADGE
jgi:hypothetical protein